MKPLSNDDFDVGFSGISVKKRERYKSNNRCLRNMDFFSQKTVTVIISAVCLSCKIENTDK